MSPEKSHSYLKYQLMIWYILEKRKLSLIQLLESTNQTAEEVEKEMRKE